MLIESSSLPSGQGFQSSEYLTAFYGNAWRRFHHSTPSGSFDHYPVLSSIEGTPYRYVEAWRGYAEPSLCGDLDYFGSSLKAYSHWCREQSIVCELIRLDPLGELSQKIPIMEDVVFHKGQPVALLVTPPDYDTYFNRLAAPCQRVLRAAEKDFRIAPILSDDDRALEEAAALHLRTMRRVQASAKWIVPPESLKMLAAAPGFSCFGVRNKRSDEIVSFAATLCHGNALHILLIANALGEEGKGASDFTYAEMVRYASIRRDTIHRIYFGGGRTLEGGDSLFKFKLKYSLGHFSCCHYLAIVHDRRAAKKLEQRTARRPEANEPLNHLQKLFFPFL